MTLPTVYSFADVDALSGGLNGFLEKLSRESIERHGVFSVAISGGSLPKIVSKQLAHNPNVDFSHWHLFWADERCVAHDDADSNFLEVKKSLLDHIPSLPQENIYAIHEGYAKAQEVEKAAVDYEEKLKRFFKGLPKFDVILLGMGPDGHCCSLFPGHPLLDEQTRWVAPISDSPKPPPKRITLTYPVVNNAQCVVFVTAGEGKKEMVQQIIEEPQHSYPCQRVQPKHGKLYWFIDDAAASKLKKESRSDYKL
ncbi:6-phosphogluconolactonase [Sporodiniella umbellata]|nr:6-phosphogluconolactonase [Sporodiniella umbellata]